ncbi:Pectin acetylesterase 5 [Zea mays]|uniref:Pectin acetylesterase n=1 Tax=Zea mays TaxID=4577 RepID=A0A3L6FKX2_MAIZE|nr:Pectin acetylesterase 5 [Zea mays]
MATELQSPLLPPPPLPPQRRLSPRAAAWAALAVSATVLLLPFLIGSTTRTTSSSSTRHPRPRSSPPSNPVELTLLTAARDKGAVCLDGSPPGYHLQAGSGAGSGSWLIHLMGGGWCDTVRSCSDRRTTYLGSSLFMQKVMDFTGILSNDPAQNPDFYSWNRVFVRYCDGASFSGDSQREAGPGNGTLFFRGLRIWEAVLDELMHKGLAHSKQASCSAGGLATLLHCDDFRARFPPEVPVKCLSDAGFFVDAKDLSGQRSMRAVYSGVVHLQNVTKVLPKDCLLANKDDPTQCFFPAELIKSISTPTLIVNSAYDSWQFYLIRVASSAAFRKTMVDDLVEAADGTNSSWFIDSCFTHCQTIFDTSGWNSAAAPRIGNKQTLTEVIGDWYFGRSPSPVVRQVGCEYPCNPTCNSQPPVAGFYHKALPPREQANILVLG